MLEANTLKNDELPERPNRSENKISQYLRPSDLQSWVFKPSTGVRPSLRANIVATEGVLEREGPEEQTANGMSGTVDGHRLNLGGLASRSTCSLVSC